MITKDQITEIGRLNQPHGIKGEINATFPFDIDINRLSCIILDIDGIFVPFYIVSNRTRGAQSRLIIIDGVDNEVRASSLSNKTIYALKEEVAPLVDDDDDADGFYAEDLIDYTITDTEGNLSGTITDIDDSTENVLFVVTTDSGRKHLIPVADELISDIDTENKHITVELPTGLLDI